MATSDTPLTVFAHINGGWAPCGQLRLTERDNTPVASDFAYGLNYLKRPDAVEVDPVSLSIANRSQVSGQRLRPVNNLELFGGIRDAAPDAWGRRVIEAKLKVPANTLPESQYLLHAGSERVGALDIRRSLQDSPAPGRTDWHSLQHLMEAAERIEAGLPVPAHLDTIFLAGTSLGGARPKASVRDDDGVLWLAKFSSAQDRVDVPAIESASLQLARVASLTVPDVRTTWVGDRRVMLIKRFDRIWHPCTSVMSPHSSAETPASTEHRLPFNSGLTLLGCDESESRTKGYGDLADAIRRHVHTDCVRDNNAELFKRMVFNILVSNDDDHLRNHGFLWDPTFKGWCLSPLYDVMPRASLASERFLHLSIGPQGRLATLDNALAAGARFSLPEREALQAIDQVWRVVRQWRMYFDEFGVQEQDMERIAPAFRHIDDISSTELRRKLP
ncbi:type II toxin-antitoxin system HipA family toxin [Roseateles terrae]|uniref:Serine/threonine-protein kinase HipA n=1 Tax=Roseateles terrae TaxID=431060 RepID=A0ABR6GUZ9_9BURK|nr:HipA domain-containing protein [Roseateles terrae]MBB3194968.1 serine/threonine-protein kinase HipA [Roseateles terrae]OWQ85788.1 hypothetical protein CDN98_13725 [Roseateles terrae]